MNSEYLIIPLKQEFALQIISWRYPPPYEVYNLGAEELELLMDPIYQYHQVQDPAGNPVGFCCFGEDAQVPGGDYPQSGSVYLDVGVGMRPELTGRGLGVGFVGAILDFGLANFHPDYFRVTVAKFNQRSLNTFRKLGFVETILFNRKPDGMPFFQLERKADE